MIHSTGNTYPRVQYCAQMQDTLKLPLHVPKFMARLNHGHVAITQRVRTTGVLALLKYRFCPKMDADMATNVIATVKIVSACRQKSGSVLLKIALKELLGVKWCQTHVAGCMLEGRIRSDKLCMLR